MNLNKKSIIIRAIRTARTLTPNRSMAPFTICHASRNSTCSLWLWHCTWMLIVWFWLVLVPRVISLRPGVRLKRISLTGWSLFYSGTFHSIAFITVAPILPVLISKHSVVTLFTAGMGSIVFLSSLGLSLLLLFMFVFVASTHVVKAYFIVMFMNCVHITHSALIKGTLFVEVVFFYGGLLFLLGLLLLLLLWSSIGVSPFRLSLVWWSLLLLRWGDWLIFLVIIVLVVFIFCIQKSLIPFSLYHELDHLIFCFTLWVLANCWLDIFKVHLIFLITVITHPVRVFYLIIFFTLDLYWFRFPFF